MPADPNGAWYTSGIRLGTPALTTRGFGHDEFDRVAELIVDVLQNTQPGTTKAGAPSKATYTLADGRRRPGPGRVGRDARQAPALPGARAELTPGSGGGLEQVEAEAGDPRRSAAISCSSGVGSASRSSTGSADRPAEEEQLEGVGAPDGAPRGRRSPRRGARRTYARDDHLVELGQPAGRQAPDLHVADEQLAEVEAQRRGIQNPKSISVKSLGPGSSEQVVGAGVAVRGAAGTGLELVGVLRDPVSGRRQAVAQVVVEGAGHQRVLPQLLGRSAPGARAAAAVPRRRCATVHSSVTDAGELRHAPGSRRADPGGTPRVRSGRRPRGGPATGTFSSQTAVESSSRSKTASARGIVRPSGRTGHRGRSGRSSASVRHGTRSAPPVALLGWHHLEERRAGPRLDVLDEHARTCAARGPCRRSRCTHAAGGRRDRGEVVVDGLGPRFDHVHPRLVEEVGHQTAQLRRRRRRRHRGRCGRSWSLRVLGEKATFSFRTVLEDLALGR